MRKQIFIHGSDRKSLHKHIHAAHLPTRYGGTLPEFNYTDWMKYIVSSDTVIEEMRNLQYMVTLEELIETRRKFAAELEIEEETRRKYAAKIEN